MKFTTANIQDYCIERSSTPSINCDNLQKFTLENIPMSQMLVGKLEASFLSFLISSLEVKSILEIGTYTGYSALAMAESLPSDGKILTLDIDPDTAEIAQKFWKESDSSHKIKQIVAPALESLKEIKDEFDLVFIDADKINYPNYLEKSLELLSDKGIIVMDNMLWSGKVLLENQDPSTEAIKSVNKLVEQNQNLESTLLPIRDGMLLIKKI